MVEIITEIEKLSNINKNIYQMAERVYQQLGTGHTEFIYHRAMEIELRLHNYKFDSEKRVLITYEINGDKYNLGEERIDLYLHDEKVIIELKAIINNPKENEIAQVYKYYRELKKEGVVTNYGIIINFPQAGVKEAKNNIDFILIKFD